MGNQQERLADLHWLGGVIDGEGSFSMVYGTPNRRNGKRSPFIGVRFGLVNTSDAMVTEVRRQLDREGVPYHVQLRPPTIGQKPVWHLSISGMKRTRRLLMAVAPFLRSKAPEALLVIRFIESRMARPNGAPYSEEEVNWFLQLRELHGYRLRESPESIRRALLKGRCAPNSERKPERVAEMTAPVEVAGNSLL